MKTLDEIFAADRPNSDIIDDLKEYRRNVLILPQWADLVKEYNPKQHAIITDIINYPNKKKYNEEGNEVGEFKRARIGVGLEKLATKRISQFMFTNPVENICEDTIDTSKKDQLNAIKKILVKNDWDSLNFERCRIVSSECEAAVHWYTTEDKDQNSKYGFKTKFRLNHTIYSPSLGDALYPYFDNNGDMIAFSREYVITEGTDSKTTYFECYTAEKIYKWSSTEEWGDPETTDNTIGKIPIIYTYRSQPIWEDADHGKRENIEELISDNGETIAYNQDPIILFHGQIDKAPGKGQNKIYSSQDKEAGAEYVLWDQAPEAIKFQFETLKSLFFMELQLPDISFENLQGLGSGQSGESRKWLLAEAHLKVGEESKIYLSSMRREHSVIKAYMKLMNTSWKDTIDDLEIEPAIVPFMINDQSDTVKMLVLANAGQAILSQKTAIALSGLVNDVDAEYEQLKKETDAANMANLGNPTF